MSKLNVEKELTRFVLEQLKEGRLEKDKALLYLRHIKGKRPEIDPRLAIIGFACRFAGANSASELWEELVTCVHAVSDLPQARYDDARRTLARFGIDEMESFWAGYLERIDAFDAEHFKIAPRVALQMDPYQRLMLEVMGEAIDHAGYSRSSMYASRTGIYVGTDHTHKLLMSYLALLQDQESYDFMTMTGSWTGILASRLAYLYNLRGPAQVIDTACSSGLVALDAAAGALRRGECDTAIVAGINLYLAPQRMGIAADIESKQALVRTFDSRASGTVWGEGVCALLLKPLARAMRDGDYVHAVVRSTAVNNDGASNGISAPNLQAQVDVLSRAWQQAGIDPAKLSYIETHGTGTALGDHIEIKALTEALGKHTQKRQFCGVGSIKTNIGHTVGAAGLASLIKVLLSFEHDVLPASLHFEQPNPLIDFCNAPIYVVDRKRLWPRGQKPRLAGVSSFSLCGTNCHVVLEEAPAQKDTKSLGLRPCLFTLSARTKDLFFVAVERFERFLTENHSFNLEDLCYTAAVGREHESLRMAVVTDSIDNLIRALNRLRRQKPKVEQIPTKQLNSALFLSPILLSTVVEPPKGQNSVTSHQFIPSDEIASAILKQDQRSEALTQLAQAYVTGRNVDWAALYEPMGTRRLPLPPVPLEQSRYWVSLPEPGNQTATPPQSSVHPVIPLPPPTSRESFAVTLSGKNSDEITETERLVANVWAQVLGLTNLDLRHDFYELGGDSVAAARVTNALSAALGAEIPVAELLRRPILEKFSAWLVDYTSAHLDHTPSINSNRQVENLALLAQDVSKPRAQSAYPVSSAQRRMFFLTQLAPENIAYNVSGCVHIMSECDLPAIKDAMFSLIERHESLRTSLMMPDEMSVEPLQVVHPTVEIPLKHHKLPKQIAQRDIQSIFSEFVRPFDLSQAPLWHAGIVDMGTDGWYFMIDAHHSVADGASMGVLVRELVALLEGQALAPLPMQYRDYALQERNRLNTPDWTPHLEYFKDRFAKLPIPLDLPTDFPRPQSQSFAGARVLFDLDAAITEKISALARTSHTTPFVVMLSVFSVLLSKYTGQPDVVVGTPVHGRWHPELEGLIGMFVNTLALRSTPHSELSCLEYLNQAKECVIEAFEHKDCPFDRLVETLDLPRDTGRNPLFDASFVLQNEDMGFCREGVTPLDLEGGKARFDLTLLCRNMGERFRCELEYCTKLFSGETASRMARHFVHLLREFCTQPERRLGDVPIAEPGEQAEALERSRATRRPYGHDESVQSRFRDQVKAHSDAIAVSEAFARRGQVQPASLTYRQLDDFSNNVAHKLLASGVKAGSVVPVFVNKYVDTIAALLGVLKAGCAYLPLDEELPENRKRFLITDCGARFVLLDRNRHKTQQAIISACAATAVFIPNGFEAVHEKPETGPLPHGVGGDDLAYVLYTSGSTGDPKGVCVPHRAILRLVQRQDFADLSSELKVLQTGAIDFDASTFEIWGPLLNGGTVVLLSKTDLLEPKRLKAALVSHKITTIWMSSPFFNQILEADESLFDSLSHLLVGGDVVSPTHVRRLRARKPHLRITNGYGPTENTTFSAVYEIPIGSAVREPIPIGKPIANSSCYVVDPNGALLPIGARGELWVGGDGVALGYLNREDLTRTAFLADPFVPGGRVYRTGDCVRWLSDGNLEFLGRLDHQVKIRGFRVELGEIEVRLTEHERVREACVVSRGESNESRSLCAYVATDVSLTSAQMVKHLEARLPAYMIPSTYVFLEQLPLNKNGKVDRTKLPPPVILARRLDNGRVLPAERKILDIVMQLLNIGEPSLEDDFFSLGGDSIKAIQLCAQARARGLGLEVRDVFNHPVIRELAASADELQDTVRAVSDAGPIPLTPIQSWFFEQCFTDMHHFTQGVALDFRRPLEAKLLRQAWERVVAEHAALRTTYAATDCGAEVEARVQTPKTTCEYAFTEASVSEKDSQTAREQMQAHTVALNRKLDLAQGPISALGLYHRQKGDTLHIVVHHLAVDAVSWSILLDDLFAAYQCGARGQDMILPPSTDSFGLWAQMVKTSANTENMGRAHAHWTRLAHQVQTRPKLFPSIKRPIATQIKKSSFALSAEQTDQLRREAKRTFGADIQEALLCTLGQSLMRCMGEGPFVVQVEGHGRDLIDSDVDVSRTVGWFTSAYPVVLSPTCDLSHNLKSVKESLRSAPEAGGTFGLLRYTNQNLGKSAGSIYESLTPEICFNFLGEVVPSLDVSQGVEISVLPRELTRSPLQEVPFNIDVEASIINDALSVTFRCGSPSAGKRLDQALVEAFERELQGLLVHLKQISIREHTASDYGASDVNEDELAAIFHELAVRK